MGRFGRRAAASAYSAANIDSSCGSLATPGARWSVILDTTVPLCIPNRLVTLHSREGVGEGLHRPGRVSAMFPHNPKEMNPTSALINIYAEVHGAL